MRILIIKPIQFRKSHLYFTLVSVRLDELAEPI